MAPQVSSLLLDPHAAASHADRQYGSAFAFDQPGHPVSGIGRGQEQYAPTTASAAHLSGLGAAPASHGDQPVDQRSGDTRRIAAAVGPFFAKQTSGLRPVGAFQRTPHGDGDGRDPLAISIDALVPIDMSLGYFPIVDAGIPRDAGVGEHDALLQVARIDADRDAPDSGAA